MTYYTNSNQISELMKQIAEVEVKRLAEVEEKSTDNTFDETDVAVYIFDNLFDSMYGQIPDLPWQTSMILWRRPDWGGMILELMKKRSEQVFLFWGEWCRVLYNSDKDHFRFIRCSNPTMDADRTCLIATANLTYLAWEAIRDLMEPIQFGQSMILRILRREEEASNVKSLFTCTKGDYKELCLKMEQLTLNVMHQHDLWKDRFFYEAIHADENNLREICKEEMRVAFFVNGDKKGALKWRPGTSYCSHRNCKYYGMMSFEDPETVELME